MRLSHLQRWMQAVVVHPGTTREALRSRGASSWIRPDRLESVLLPSETLPAEKRIAIYQEMYPLRMRDALASDYPALEHFLGDRFQDFIVAYTAAHPSRGYTLNRLGDRVPAFLGRQKKLQPRAFLKDLARLELAVTEAFDAPESGRLGAGDLEALAPSQLGRTRLVTAASLRLVSLSWNASEYLDTIRDGKHRHPRPTRRRSFVAVVRRDYSVSRFPLTEAGFAVLGDLREGRNVESVVQRALSRRGTRRAAPEDFGRWFKLWTGEGVFSGIGKSRAARRREATSRR